VSRVAAGADIALPGGPGGRGKWPVGETGNFGVCQCSPGSPGNFGVLFFGVYRGTSASKVTDLVTNTPA
jgi:hypothetical protein